MADSKLKSFEKKKRKSTQRHISHELPRRRHSSIIGILDTAADQYSQRGGSDVTICSYNICTLCVLKWCVP